MLTRSMWFRKGTWWGESEFTEDIIAGLRAEEVKPKEDAGQARTRTEMPEEVLEISEEDEYWSEEKRCM